MKTVVSRQTQMSSGVPRWNKGCEGRAARIEGRAKSPWEITLKQPRCRGKGMPHSCSSCSSCASCY